MQKCEYSNQCGACSLWEIPYADELKRKENIFKSFLEEEALPSCEIEILNCGYTQLRDRADLQWREQIGWGFFAKNQSQIFPIKACLLFSPELQKFYAWFSTLVLPVPVASARLRVSPDGAWGVWLDMANIHVKILLEEKNYLLALQSKAFVEIGQRRKKLILVNDSNISTATAGPNVSKPVVTNINTIGVIKFKLSDPEFLPWFQTYSNKAEPLPLYCSVGAFTQVGFASNKLLVNSVLSYLARTSSQEVMELGSGIGNFTLAILSTGAQVLAIENDKLALAAFALNLDANFKEYLSKLNLQQVDFNQVNSAFIKLQLRNPKETSLLVDPPRSGLGRFLTYDFWQERPFASIVYVSCSLASWAKDAKLLLSYGYQLKKITLVDQFPRTDHIESISYWQ